MKTNDSIFKRAGMRAFALISIKHRYHSAALIPKLTSLEDC